MPNSGNPRKDPRGLNFIDITDFTPGIYSYSPDMFEAGSNQPLPSSYPAPLGSATVANTWGCLPLPQGGLTPGPGFQDSVGPADLGGWTGRTYTTSFYVKTNTVGGNPEFIFTREGILTSSSAWQQNLTSLYQGTASAITNGSMGYTGVTTAIPRGSITVTSRQGPAVPAAFPVIAVSLPTPYQTQETNDFPSPLLLYPDPTDSTTYALLQALEIGATVGGNDVTSSGLLAAYEGRIVEFYENYLAVGNGGSFTWDNDQVNFTDPPGISVLGAQAEAFVPENPYGYSCAGSISDGELFLVKRVEAGAVLTGDMNNPSVTYLPGIQPGGGHPSNTLTGLPLGPFGQGCSSTNGFYYCSSNYGAYMWNGGNTTTKISKQLDDNFFFDPSFGFSGMSFYIQKWGQYLLFSNSWIYDELTGGWWRIRKQGPTVPTYFWYGLDFDNEAFYAAPTSTQYPSTNPTWTYPNTNLCDRYIRTIPASTYSWQSQPIPLVEDQQVDIQEINIKARAPSATYSTSSISVYLTNELGTTTEFQTVNNMTANDLPAIYRSTGRFRAQQLQVTVVPNNTAGGAAPTIFSISVGYKSREKIGVTV